MRSPLFQPRSYLRGPGFPLDGMNRSSISEVHTVSFSVFDGDQRRTFTSRSWFLGPAETPVLKAMYKARLRSVSRAICVPCQRFRAQSTSSRLQRVRTTSKAAISSSESFVSRGQNAAYCKIHGQVSAFARTTGRSMRVLWRCYALLY